MPTSNVELVGDAATSASAPRVARLGLTAVYALADATRSDSSSDRVLSARLLHQIGTRLAEEWRSDGRRPRLC